MKKQLNKVSIVTVATLAVSLVLGLAGPITVFAATSPTLGTADSFAVLADDLISSAGNAADITGDVGLYAGTGAAIGVQCAEVNGTIYDRDGAYTGAGGGDTTCRIIDDPLLLGAKNDLGTAYDDLAATPNDICTTDYGVGPQDLTLVSPLAPGVYCVGAGGFQLSGDLTLDASGVYIFRSATTIITSPDSSITGGDSCNVWWRAETSVTLDTTTEFVGNVLALADISMLTGATLDGRALARNGQVTLDSNTITVPTCNATLNVIKVVDGGTADPSDFSVHVTDDTDADVTGSPQLGEGFPGTPYTLGAGTYTVSEDAPARYSATFSGDCAPSGSITLVADTDYTCTITNTRISSGGGGSSTIVPPPTPTPTPTSIAFTPTPTPTPLVAPAVINNLPKTGIGPNLPNLPWQLPVFIIAGFAIVAALIKRKLIFPT